MKLAICLPGATFTKGFVESIMQVTAKIMMWPKGSAVFQITDYSADLYNLKNTMIDKALAHGADYLMWIDSDMVFKAEDIEKLLTREVDIVSGIALIEPGRCAIANVSDDKLKPIYLTPDKITDDKLHAVDYCGGAFLLVKADVYRKIPALWYETINVEINGKQRLVSEDFGFCEKAQSYGYKIHADYSVKVGHEKRTILWP